MPEIARFLGHKNSRITEEVYARFSPDFLSRAARSLDLFANEQSNIVWFNDTTMDDKKGTNVLQLEDDVERRATRI